MSLQIRIGEGDLLPLTSLFTAALMESANGGIERLVLDRGQSISTLNFIAPNESVEIFVDGTRRFIGWRSLAPGSASGGRHARRYQIDGPSRWMMRHTFKRGDGSYVTIGRVDEENRRPMGEQIAEILLAAKTRFPGKFDYDLGGIDAEHAALPVAWEVRMDDKCGTALESVLRWVPGLVYYWDVTAAVPTLRFISPADAPTAVLTESSKLTLDPNVRDDLLTATVKVFYQSELSDGNPPLRTDVYGPEGTQAHALGEDREESLTIVLQDGEPVPDTDIAKIYGEYLSRLHADIDFSERSLAWTAKLGTVFSFGSALEWMAPATSQLQLISRDLFSERTTFQAGVPRHLGLDDLFNLFRRRALARQQGGGGGDDPPPDPDPDPKWDPCTVKITIVQPQADEDSEDVLVEGAYALIKNVQILNDAEHEFEMADSSEPNVEVVMFVPPEFIAPEPFLITLNAGATVDHEKTATHNYKFTLHRNDGQDIATVLARLEVGEATELDLRNTFLADSFEYERRILLTTAPDESTPEGENKAFVMRPRLVSGLHAGAVAWRWVLASEVIVPSWPGWPE